MSDTPPPPPSGPVPPTSGPPRSAAARFQGPVKAIDGTDLALIGIGVLLFILSFLAYYKYVVTVDLGPLGGEGSSINISAWHGFFGWFAVVLALFGIALIVLPLLGIALPARVPTVTYGLFVAAFVSVLLALFVIPGDTSGVGLLGMKVDKGHGVAYWLSFVVALVGAVLGGARLAGRKLL